MLRIHGSGRRCIRGSLFSAQIDLHGRHWTAFERPEN